MNQIFSIQNLRNVFVTNNSVIIDGGNLVKASCVTDHVYKKYQEFGFKLKYFLPFFTFSNKPHILMTDEWSKNYCHWLWEALSKLVELKKKNPDAILILPKSYLKIDFVIKSLEAFGFNKNNIKTIPKKSKLYVRNLSFIPCIDIATEGYYDFLKFTEIAKTLNSYHKNNFKTNFGERIYISRSDPKKNTARKVANEDELVKMLDKYGFKTVYMENFSFLEQVSIMHDAKFILAPHGAGITNAMFASKDAHIIEFINEKWQKTCFAEMFDRTNQGYNRIDCKQIDNNTMQLSDIKVDVAAFEQKLIKILK